LNLWIFFTSYEQLGVQKYLPSFLLMELEDCFLCSEDLCDGSEPHKAKVSTEDNIYRVARVNSEIVFRLYCKEKI